MSTKRLWMRPFTGIKTSLARWRATLNETRALHVQLWVTRIKTAHSLLGNLHIGNKMIVGRISVEKAYMSTVEWTIIYFPKRCNSYDYFLFKDGSTPMIISLDGNAGLVRRKKAGTDHTESKRAHTYFLSQAEVDEYVETYRNTDSQQTRVCIPTKLYDAFPKVLSRSIHI